MLQTNITGVCGEHSQCSRHTGFDPSHGCVLSCLHCSGSRLLSRERALCCLDFPGLSHSDSGFWAFHKTQTQLGLHFVPSLAGAAQAAKNLTGALPLGAGHLLPSAVPASVSMNTSRVCLVSVLGSWSLAATLLADVNHPESQEVFG